MSSQSSDTHARRLYQRLIELGEDPKRAARLAGRPTVKAPEPAIDPKVYPTYFTLLERGFSEKEAALLVGVNPKTLASVIKRSPPLQESRARARTKAGFMVKAALINWAYKAMIEDSSNAKWASKCLMAWHRECGLPDPEVLEEQAIGDGFQIDAVILARATHDFRQRIRLGAEMAREQTGNVSVPVPNYVESKVLPSQGPAGHNDAASERAP